MTGATEQHPTLTPHYTLWNTFLVLKTQRHVLRFQSRCEHKDVTNTNLTDDAGAREEETADMTGV